LKIRSLFFFAIIALAISVFGGHALARDANGRLALIRYPVSSQPEFVHAGEQLTVDLSRAAFDACPDVLQIYLVRGETRIQATSTVLIPDPATATYRFAVTVPADTAPGAYTLAAQKCVGDTSNHAVFVMDSFPGEYTILHLTDIHVGRMGGAEPVGAAMFERMRDKANDLKPALILITGDDSDTSAPEELKRFIDILETFDAPTFVVAGNHDRNNADADSFLGPLRYFFNFGRHFYLGFDTQYEFPPPDPSGQMDWIKKKVRAHADAPFKVLFSHRMDSDFRLIITNVVKPYKVNLLLLGHKHADELEKYGASYVITTNAALDGFYRVIKVKNNAAADIQSEKLE
jgi:hypothetical protein